MPPKIFLLRMQQRPQHFHRQPFFHRGRVQTVVAVRCGQREQYDVRRAQMGGDFRRQVIGGLKSKGGNAAAGLFN